MKRYQFIQDPGHGWLVVPYAECIALNLIGVISNFSFIDDETAYLEEDRDMAVFLCYLRSAGIHEIEIETKYVQSFNRNRERFSGYDPNRKPECYFPAVSNWIE